MDLLLDYTPPPIVEKFMLEESFGRLIAGPVGSGKTHGIIVEILRRISSQAPGRDGLRHSRWAIIRQTLKQIKDTVLPDIERLLQGIENVRVSDSTIRIWYGDIRAVILLVPLEDLKDQRRLLSSQLTGVWISECIEIAIELLGPISGRLGRFPTGAFGVPTWTGIIADTNFPLEGSDWHKFMESPPVDWRVFKQPGGLAEGAENLMWLNQTEETLKLPEDDPVRLARGIAYYIRLMNNSTPEYTNRYVHAQYGTDPSGTAVYRETFTRAFHTVEQIEPTPGRMIIVGQDFGRNPCAIITQLDHLGRLLVLEEIISLEMGLQSHLTERLRPALNQERYYGCPVLVVGDPAGRAKSSLFEINEFDLLKSFRFAAFPAPTNDPEPRIQSVEGFLHGQYKGSGRMLIDKRYCPTTIEGFVGGYKYAKLKDGEMKAKPDKNKWSHVHDALQYACLVAGSPGSYSMGLSRAARGQMSMPQKAVPARAWT